MRTVWLPSLILLTTACSSSNAGGSGSVNLSFGDAGATGMGVFTTTPTGAAMIQGEFSASGDFEGLYTLSASVPVGSALATCLVSVDDGAPGTSVQLDASTSQVHALTVEIGTGAAYQGQAICNVTATNNARPNIGNEVTIDVSGAGDAG